LGVIQRQSLKYTIVNFVGTFIGFLSVIFIYPLEKDLNGYFQYLFSAASLLVPILGLGIHAAIVKYYPVFVQKQRQDHFLSFTLSLATLAAIGTTLILAIIYRFSEGVFAYILPNYGFIKDNITQVLILSYLLLYASIFFFHATVRYRIVIPDIIYTLALKLFLPVLVLMVFWGWIDRAYFAYVVLMYFFIVMILLAVYLFYLDKHSLRPSWDVLDRKEYKGFFSFMGFAFLNGLGATLALRLDIIMIAGMINTHAVYIYTTIMTISNVIEIPAKALNQIASPVISNSWTQGDTQNIKDIYQQSSVYGWIGGLFLFLLLFFIWGDLLHLMPAKFDINLPEVLTIFALLSAARIMDLVTGVNSVIISYSESFRFHMYFLLAMGGINIILNYFFITKYGVVGAAMATFVAYIVFNILKHLLLKYRYGFFIAWKDHYRILGVGIIVFGIMYLLQVSFHPIFNIIIRSSLTSILFFSLIYWVNPGGDIRNIVKGFLDKYSWVLSKVKHR
jgi:O-antigen/teichoic acid export membrane protein